MIAHALTYLRTLRLLRNTFIGTARPPLINFCSHHAFPGNGRQFWSSSLLLLIASEVADFLITCFCFAIIVFCWKRRAQQLFSDSLPNFSNPNLAEYIWDLPCIKGEHFSVMHYTSPRLRVSPREPIMPVSARLKHAEIKKRAFQSKRLH